MSNRIAKSKSVAIDRRRIFHRIHLTRQTANRAGPLSSSIRQPHRKIPTIKYCRSKTDLILPTLLPSQHPPSRNISHPYPHTILPKKPRQNYPWIIYSAISLTRLYVSPLRCAPVEMTGKQTFGRNDHSCGSLLRSKGLKSGPLFA